MTSSLAALKSKLKTQMENKNSGGEFSSTLYPIWKINEGDTAIIRFLPIDGEEFFWKEEKVHNIPDPQDPSKTITVYCKENEEGVKCPICEYARDAYKRDDRDTGNKFWRKVRYAANALILKDPIPVADGGESYNGKIQTLRFSKQIQDIIINRIVDEDDPLAENPCSLEGGYNFLLKVSKDGQWRTYKFSKFATSQHPLTPEELEMLNTEWPDLNKTLVAAKTSEELVDMLNASLNAIANGVVPTHTTDSTYTPPAPPASRPAIVQAMARPAEETTPEAKPTLSAAEILAQVRARSANKSE